MGRESHDPTVVHSSIALLQERFRQLQRVKEMREERELRKMLAHEPKQLSSNNHTMSYEPTTRVFSHPELIAPSSRSPPHFSLSLWPISQANQEDQRSFQNPVSMDLCPTYTHTHAQTLQASWKNVHDWDSGSDSGVDTSLHL